MAEPFKNLVNAALVQAAAGHLQRSWPAFDARRFEGLACTGLQALELKARALQVCAALEATLPQDFAVAADLIEAALAAVEADADNDSGLRGWILWPVGEFVARRGQQQPERALAVLHALTQRFTAEFAIRPFIVHHPALTFATLRRWCQDPSARVRRLVSEGSRPRLPWGLRLQSLVADPAPTLPLLLALQDDPDESVRRSVANHLNDIAKDHPDLVAGWLEQHLPGATAPRRALLRHASRTLIKQGDPAVLRAWGLGLPFGGSSTLVVSPTSVRAGAAFQLDLQLRSHAPHAQRLAIDYAVHHVKANGSTSAKVFKGWQLELPAHAELGLQRSHSMRPITTRRYHPGRHRVHVQINGQVVAEAAFDLLP